MKRQIQTEERSRDASAKKEMTRIEAKKQAEKDGFIGMQ